MLSWAVRGLFVLAGAAAALIANGCSSDRSEVPDSDGGDRVGDGVGDTQDTHNDASASDVVPDSVPDDGERAGFNRTFATLSRGGVRCRVKTDIDVTSDSVVALCDSTPEGPDNHVAFIAIDPADPIATSEPRFSEQNLAHPEGSSDSYVSPGIRPKPDGRIAMPLQNAGYRKMFADVPERGDIYASSLVPTSGVDPYNVSSLFKLGSYLCVFGTRGIDGPPVVVSYGVRRDGALEPNRGPRPVYIPGRIPMAIEHVGGTRAAAVADNCEDGNSCVSYIDLAASGTAPRIETTLPLGFHTLPGQKELSCTEDTEFCTAASANGDFRVLRNVAPAEITGGFNVADSVTSASRVFRFMASESNGGARRAYLDTEKEVISINFDDPANPVVDMLLRNVGSNLGPIAVRNGVIYVVDNRPGEDGVETSYIVAIDPSRFAKRK